MDGKNVRAHLEQLVLQLGFKPITVNSDKNSHYFELRHNGKLLLSVIRISNHCTDASTWKDRYDSATPTIRLSKKEIRRYRGNYNGLSNKYFQKRFLSVVIYQPEIDGEQVCNTIQDGNIVVNQIVKNADLLNNEMLVEIESNIIAFANNMDNNQNNIKENTNMKKNRIRLTESQLHRVIKESVKKVLKESVEGEIDDYSMQHNWPLFYCNYYEGPEAPENSSKEDENEYSWKSLNALNNLKKSDMKSSQEVEDVFNKFAPSRKDFMDGMYDNTLDSMFYERLKNDLDNKWKNTKDVEKYSKQADSHPLHRKGSLNRELDESIRKAIKKSLN